VSSSTMGETEWVPVSRLTHYPGNPRIGDVASIARSLDRNGQYRPLVVDRRNGQVLAGNHTLKAARSLGWDEIAVTWVDVDDQAARRIVLVDNRSNDAASYDESALHELLETVLEENDWDGTGYDDAVIRTMLGIVESTDAGDAFSGLPDSDRSPITQQTYTLTHEQAGIVADAVDRARRLMPDEPTGNDNPNGNGLAWLCARWLAMTSAEGDG